MDNLTFLYNKRGCGFIAEITIHKKDIAKEQCPFYGRGDGT